MTHSQGLPESLIEKESTKFAKIAWDAGEAVSALNTETLTTQGSALRSLRIMYVVPGDVVYIPFGTMICEKVLGGHCMALREQCRDDVLKVDPPSEEPLVDINTADKPQPCEADMKSNGDDNTVNDNDDDIQDLSNPPANLRDILTKNDFAKVPMAIKKCENHPRFKEYLSWMTVHIIDADGEDWAFGSDELSDPLEDVIHFIGWLNNRLPEQQQKAVKRSKCDDDAAEGRGQGNNSGSSASSGPKHINFDDIPHDLESVLRADEVQEVEALRSYDFGAELERIKVHPKFNEFLKWGVDTNEFEDGYDISDPESDLVENILQFTTWLQSTSKDQGSKAVKAPAPDSCMEETKETHEEAQHPSLLQKEDGDIGEHPSHEPGHINVGNATDEVVTSEPQPTAPVSEAKYPSSDSNNDKGQHGNTNEHVNEKEAEQVRVPAHTDAMSVDAPEPSPGVSMQVGSDGNSGDREQQPDQAVEVEMSQQEGSESVAPSPASPLTDAGSDYVMASQNSLEKMKIESEKKKDKKKDNTAKGKDKKDSPSKKSKSSPSKKSSSKESKEKKKTDKVDKVDKMSKTKAKEIEVAMPPPKRRANGKTSAGSAAKETWLASAISHQPVKVRGWAAG
ncbi:unnamed protein product, partial [Durusdinium trenchii]